MNKYLLGCDWGTTSFRLRLIRLADQIILDEIVSQQGVGAAFAEWKSQESETDRRTFFLLILNEQIQNLGLKSRISLNGIAVVISGMASSSIGMHEVAYASLPFPLDGSEAVVYHIDEKCDFPHDILLLSGVCSEKDVMRGEETELIGLTQTADLQKIESAIFLFPGTHSKHLYIEGQQLTNFKTYMTGEVFKLMARQSILRDSVEFSESDSISDQNADAFRAGVVESGSDNLLNALFNVRTNQLFQKLGKEENAMFLSGLLIGSELRHLVKENDKQLVLCSGNALYELYKLALNHLKLSDRTITIPAELADRAAVAGQIKIFQNHEVAMNKVGQPK